MCVYFESVLIYTHISSQTAILCAGYCYSCTCLSLLHPCVQATTGGGSSSIDFQTSLTSFATSVHVVTLVPTSPAHRMSLQGQVAYGDSVATNKRLFFDASLSISDFIRYRTHTSLQIYIYNA